MFSQVDPCQADFCGLPACRSHPMEVRQRWVYGGGPGKHFAGDLRGVGTFLNWQVLTFLSQRIWSLLLNNEHCRFTVQNCTHISFTCRCLISIPITNSMHKQSSIVSTLRINHILFKKKFDICISKLLPILNIYSTKLGKIVVLFQIIPAPWALPQNVKLQNI